MIRAGGLRSAVASSNSADRIIKTVQHFGMGKLLDTIVGIDEVPEGKPDPALVTVAVRRIGVAPNEAIYVGDSEFDIEAGRASGTRTALVVQPIASQSKLKFQPDYRLKKLLELRKVIWPMK